MNELTASIIIAIVQGIAEWFPISSSGHLVLAERILSFGGGIDFDVAMHFGTLMAVFVYFGRDISEIVKAVFSGKFGSENGKLGLLVLAATIPAAIIGYFFENVFEGAFENLLVVAIGFAVTGILLFISSFRFNFGKKNFNEFGFGGAFVVGLAQIFALFPGISRSGTTISASLLSGLNEKNALKFSFLMSIPVIFGANVLVLGNEKISSSFILPTLISFVVGLIAIYLLYEKVLTDKKNLRWFAIYVFIIAIVTLGIWAFFG